MNRPLNAQERAEKVPEVISVDEASRALRVGEKTRGERASSALGATTTGNERQGEREFKFDDVFGPSSTQERVYESAVKPMVRDVLDGYNCTVFAYGQTGTGKTHTMSGAHDAECDVLSSEAGIIPRAMSDVFEYLEHADLEYSVKVTYLELYNEEITDLIGPAVEADGSNKTKHSLMEDGKGAVTVKGLEEVYVGSMQEVFAVLNRGSTRRRTEATLLNKQSSRSHSVFSVTVHITDVSPDGEQFVRCGKLNLVDLAGSENISRSGAKDSRAREAGEINKSLVALGRVITALVDKLGHVPYRDSKLTRLLRDALGGKCRTLVIATVSPASHSVEETLSTLEYAYRAKNIKNKPVTNGKTPKSVFMKELQNEIERLQSDLIATREKNGVYMSKNNYDAEQNAHTASRRRAEELECKLASAQAEHDKVARMFEKTKKSLLQLKEEHAGVEAQLGEARDTLGATTSELRETKKSVAEKDYLLGEFEKSHAGLSSATNRMAKDLIAAKDEATKLFDKIERKENVMTSNADAIQALRVSMCERLEALESGLEGIQEVERDSRVHMKTVLDEFMKRKESEMNVLKASIANMQTVIESAARRASEHARTSMLKQADLLTRAAEELRAGAEVTSEAAVQAVVASRRGCDETVESLLRSLDSDRAAFSDLADTVAATSTRGVADFMSKHARDLTRMREQFATSLNAAVERDVPTGNTPARESARVFLAEPVTPSAFTFRRDQVASGDSADPKRAADARANRSPFARVN